MWKQRTQDEPAQAPVRPGATTGIAVPAAEPVRRESNINMSTPARTLESESAAVRNGSAALGKNVTVKGQIFAREDLTIDGEVEGTVECHEHRLTIGPNARVQAGLKAREIVIHGSIQGNVEAADKIDIKKEAKLVGDIKTSRIVIEDGAYFKGSIDISKAAAATKGGPPVVQVPATATSGTPVAAPSPGSGAVANTAASSSR